MGRSGDPRKRGLAYGSDDPREAGGGIIGDCDDPYARDSVRIDTRNAVLLDATTVSVLTQANGDEMVAMVLAGRINQKHKRTKILYVFDEDGAAAIITELMALADRAGWGERLRTAIDRRQAVLDALAPLGVRATVEDALKPAQGSPASGDV